MKSLSDSFIKLLLFLLSFASVLIAVASKCNRQENEIDESNVSKEDMKDEYNKTIADVDDGTMSEASDSERCEGVIVEERHQSCYL
jgi:outer membrane protein assembly factor BamD (BamD/ComL family)